MNLSALPATRSRIYSIDFLRGAVMIIMALDHTRDFFHFDAWLHDPLDLSTTSPFLYFTRWITHFCAPVFVFLAGASAYFQRRRKSTQELSRFLLTRGLWLMFIEVMVVNLIVTFDPSYSLVALQTIWAIGTSMFVLGLVVWLPYGLILSLGVLIVFGHNLLDFVEANHTAPFGFWWDLLHASRFSVYPVFGNHSVLIIYPFVAWAGLMMLGYCFGKFYDPAIEPAKRSKRLLLTGSACIVFFALLRFSNLYGDPDPWSVQKNGLYTFLSFMDVHKYPPSLLFMCITIGPALLFLSRFQNWKNRFTSLVTVYGSVPFLYYLLHFFLIHLLSTWAYFLRGHSTDEIQSVMGIRFVAPGEGYHLWVVYLVWIGVVVALYPVCAWFSRYKAAHKDQWWLSYL
jgi:uncharacterized membrane protein